MIERHEETTCDVKPAEEEVKPEVEPLPDKPKDANSEIVPNQNLTDDEIAQLILEEEELLSDKGLLGYSHLVALCVASLLLTIRTFLHSHSTRVSE